MGLVAVVAQFYNPSTYIVRTSLATSDPVLEKIKVKRPVSDQVVVVYTFNSSTQKAEGGGSL